MAPKKRKVPNKNITPLIFLSLSIVGVMTLILLFKNLRPLSAEDPTSQTKTPAPLWGDAPGTRPSCVRGIHLTAWCAGHKRLRAEIEDLLATTELNTVVIAVKEVNGEVFIPGIPWEASLFENVTDPNLKPYRSAVPDIQQYLTYLKDRGIFTIARITVFQDQILPKIKPEWAVQSSTPLPKALAKGFQPQVWVDRRGLAWTDPYNPQVQKYNIDVAVRAAQLGFQGIQFDYIRYPSDGKTNLCRYAKPHSRKTGPKNLSDFLKRAKESLAPYNVELSIDVFGMAGSLKDDLGIGQKLPDLLENVDVISPMMYPSHYAAGEYGLKDPNSSPYETVHQSVKDTLDMLKDSQVELRPFFQDFSLGVKYTPERVRAQMDAAADNGVHEWILWNPRCRYTKEALKPK